jgi:elongation factor 2
MGGEMSKKGMIERIMEVMKDPTRIRNVATSSHVHHGKTTLTDNLMAGAGMIAEELAGKVMYTWFDERLY